MIVNFLTNTLQNNISLLGKIVPAHSQIPVLSSILLDATGDMFTMSSTDLEFGVRIVIPAKIEKEGGVLVPGKQFIETLSLLSSGKVKLELVSDQVILTTDTSTFKFQVMPKDDFPRLFEDKGEKTSEYTQEEFSGIFSKLLYAVSQDEARPHLTGIYMVKNGEGVDYVATDGYRMSLKRVLSDRNAGKLEAGLIMSQRLISEGLAQKGASALSLYVYPKGNQTILETEGCVLVGRMIEGTYPDYEKAIPKDSKTKIELKKSEFIEVLRSSSVFARENANIVHVHISLGKLTISVSSSSLGESKAVVEGIQTGDDNDIAFNIKFVLDFLKSVNGEKVTLQVNSSVEPALFTTEEDREYFHVIMPVRIQE